MSDNVVVSGPFTFVANGDDDQAVWLEARKGILTASDVAVVLGLKGSQLALWMEKAGRVDREFSGSAEAAEMGHVLEDPNQKLFEKKSGAKTFREQRLVVSTKYPWLGATLDCWFEHESGSLCPLELKSTADPGNWPDSESQVKDAILQRLGEPSVLYQVQNQTQMLVTGRDYGAISVVIGSPVFRHRWGVFPRHEAVMDMIINETGAFMESVRKGIMPLHDSSEQLSRSLHKMQVKERVVALSQSAAKRAERLVELQEESKRLDDQIRAERNAIMVEIGDAAVGVLPDGKSGFTFREQKRDGYTVSPSSTRVLRFTKNINGKIKE